MMHDQKVRRTVTENGGNLFEPGIPAARIDGVEHRNLLVIDEI